MARRLFCERGPVCYHISLFKEYLLRDLKTLLGGGRYAHLRSSEPLPCLVKGHVSVLLRRLEGVPMELQQGKVINLRLAAARLNGIVIRPGETNFCPARQQAKPPWAAFTGGPFF